MPAYKTKGNFIIYRGRKAAEVKYRVELSKAILEKFGRPHYEQSTITEIITFCLNYYIFAFETLCHNETSYTFYKNIFWFHEQATALVHGHLDEDELPEQISGSYIAAYRRILKFIIEMGCEVKMVSGEKADAEFRKRTAIILDDLLFLGEMIMTCVDLYAEQRMIDDVAEITFDAKDLYVFSRRHHYEVVFKFISQKLTQQITKHIVDPNGFPDFTDALSNCLGVKYEDLGHLVASIHEEIKILPGNVAAVSWDTCLVNMNNLFSVPPEKSEAFFKGIRLDSGNKMTLKELACKPYNLNRVLYRPLVLWNVDGKGYCVFGTNGLTEAFVQLTTNAIPWGKAPKEWMGNLCFQAYVHRKEDQHDGWLDDEAEARIQSTGSLYDRNVKCLRTKTSTYNIDVEGLGEIDFIIVSEDQQKIFIADCKHLLGRYDIVNQKNDFNAFVVGSKKTKSYNETMTNKLVWFRKNVNLLEQHFQKKYKRQNLPFENYTIEGIFIVNGPTFYMYNADYRIYTIDQLTDVLLDYYTDPTFTALIEEDETERIISVKYPFFKKPDYVYFDPELDGEDITEE